MRLFFLAFNAYIHKLKKYYFIYFSPGVYTLKDSISFMSVNSDPVYSIAK